MNCEEFFVAHKDDEEPIKLLQAIPHATLLEWEQQSASPHSPGVIEGQELLCRHLLNPVHIEPGTGNLKPTAFDDVSSIGLSVNRLQHRSLDQVLASAQARVDAINQNPPATGLRTLVGYAVLPVQDLRSLLTDPPEPKRATGVYDTAKPDDVSHADVCQIVPGKATKRSLRSKLYEIGKVSHKRLG